MTSKFANKGFGINKTQECDEPNKPQGFIRSKQDNTIFKNIQIKDDFFDWVDPEATIVIDADGIPFRCASSVEEDYIVIKSLLDEDNVKEDLKLIEDSEYPNISSFKGRTKGDKIAAGSPLSDLNIEREVAGLKPYEMKDIEIIKKKRLKYEKGVEIDGIKFNNSLEVCKYFIDQWIDAIKIQTRLKHVRPVIGGGKTHRHSILTPHQYKSDRGDNERPLLLPEARKYIKENYNTIVAPDLIEADEVADAMAALAYDKSISTNSKIKMIKSSFDKDARCKRGVLLDWSKSFHFKYPQCWLIHSEDRDVGHLELVKGEVKGYSLKFLCYQILMEDSADEYSARKYLPDDFEHFGNGYGDTAFYKDFEPLTTPQEVLQKLVDKYFEWFPKGVSYKAWDGTDIHEDTMSYLEKHFYLAYMREGKDDKTVIKDWFDKYSVNYSKIVNNHIEKQLPFVDEHYLQELVSNMKSIISDGKKTLSDKKGKKSDLEERLDKGVDILKQIESEIDNMFDEYKEK